MAPYSRIDSLDARITPHIDALCQALFSRKDPVAWPEPATVPLKQPSRRGCAVPLSALETKLKEIYHGTAQPQLSH